MTIQTTEQTESSIAEQIFMKPSNELIADRFSPERQTAAACTGICGSGTCKGVV